MGKANGSVVFLANVGTRDLLMNGELLQPPRDKGQEVLENYESYKSCLSMPMLEPALTQIEEREPDEITLFVTNQENAVERFQASDTLFFGQIIKRLLGERLSSVKVRLREIKQNPNLPDDMYDFFKEQFSKRWKEEIEKAYILITGGIPACNMALAFQGINYFGEKTIILYVREDTGRAYKLELVRQILDAFRRKSVNSLARSMNFKGASELLEGEDDKLWADYAYARSIFDFEKAREIGDRLWQQSRLNRRQRAGRFLDQARALSEGSPEAMLRELFFNMKLEWNKGEFTDFLGRLYRFEEALLKYVVGKYTPISTEFMSSRGKFKKRIEEFPKLLAYLEQKTVDGEKLHWDDPHSIPALKAILEFYNTGDQGVLGKVLEWCSKVEDLISLRHRTIIAHGFESATSSKIRERYEGDPVKDTEALLSALNIDASCDPFEEIQDLLQG